MASSSSSDTTDVKETCDISSGDQLKVGFIGLGNMGSHMAHNLAHWLSTNNYPALSLWNRTSSKLPPVSNSIAHAESPMAMAEACDIVITSLKSDSVAEQVYAQLLEGAKKKDKSKRTIFVETSTLYPTTAGELERAASAIPHSYYLQCPVFGPPPMAKDAKLVIVLSGPNWAKKIAEPILVPAVGRKTVDVGSNVERAAAFKLTGNMLILGSIELLSEAMTLADKTGVGSDLLLSFVKDFIPAPSWIGYGTKIATNSFEGDSGFTVEGGLKDANHLRHLAASVDATIPVIDVAHRHLITSRAHGGSQLDWSSLVSGPRLAAGLLPFTGQKSFPKDDGFGSKVEVGGKYSDANTEVEAPVKSGGIKTVQNF
ncbi:BQ2448_5320 [Microbotryum intermedium]|uniref:BQ2448_5320 protein n=1 Tax=Microbotryum intermedium TaxID=269621 RepID=A0A238F4Q9_9BASI|nr:BQ2448_5320 [Microbotryum intermedium]